MGNGNYRKKAENTGAFNIKSWAEEDRPREKFLLKGRAALSDAELIAILIGSGTTSMSAVDLARHILHEAGNDLNRLARLSVKELTRFKGMGEAKAITISAALELGRRRKDSSAEEKERVGSSIDAYNIIKPYLSDLNHEESWVLLLNRAHYVIKKEKLSAGGVAGTIIDVKILFKSALENLASSVVLIHNHPSGNLKPSAQDSAITKQVQKAGLILDIPLVDHLIFGDNGYFSFAEEGLL